jgi:hypothetical protein
MNAEEAVRALEELLRAESGSLTAHLGDAHPYVGWESGVDPLLFAQILEDQRLHVERLAGAILQLGGVPRAAPPDARTARLHYVDAGYLLPLLVEDKRRLIALYDRVAPRVAEEPAAREVVARNRAGHAAHLRRLSADRAGEGASAGPSPRAGGGAL